MAICPVVFGEHSQNKLTDGSLMGTTWFSYKQAF